MTGTMIPIPLPDGRCFQGYLSVPAAGQGPGIVLLQEIFGVNAALRAAADLFAEEGYVVLVPDLFWRLQPGIDLGYDHASVQQALGYYRRFDTDQGVRDIEAAVAALRSRQEFQGKLATVGFCLGGLLAYLSAARLDVAAAVGFYGVGIERYTREADRIRCPVLLHFGGQDEHVPASAVQTVRQALASQNDSAVHSYPDAGHGFYLPGRPSYVKTMAQVAHSRTIGLLRQVLGPRYDLDALWENHCACEFASRDADATMRTMVAEPYVNNIPTMTGGVGHTNLLRFYKHHFVQGLPNDTRLVPVSRTIGADRLVDELLFCFTHDTEIDFLLPGVKPTGKYVEVPLVAIVCFRGGKLYHEHIYWDQASVLVQIGLLDPKGLPVAGIETAKKLVDENLPSNSLLARWAASEGK